MNGCAGFVLSFLSVILFSSATAQDRGAGGKASGKPLVVPAKGGDRFVGKSKVAVQFKLGSRSGATQLFAGIATLPGGTTVPKHLHEIDEELIYVLEGEVVVTLNDQDHKAASGDLVFIPPGTWMTIENRTVKRAKVLGLIPRGEMEECMRALYGDATAVNVTREQLDSLCRLKAPESAEHGH